MLKFKRKNLTIQFSASSNEQAWVACFTLVYIYLLFSSHCRARYDKSKIPGLVSKRLQVNVNSIYFDLIFWQFTLLLVKNSYLFFFTKELQNNGKKLSLEQWAGFNGLGYFGLWQFVHTSSFRVVNETTLSKFNWLNWVSF